MGERARIFATGLGAVSPIGVGVPAFVASLRAGRSGVTALPEALGSERIRSRVAARCDDFDPRSVMSEADLARFPALVPMALAACAEAMTNAGLSVGAHDPGSERELEGRRRIGLTLGTGGGGIDFTLDQFGAAMTGRKPSLWTITNATHGNLAGELSIRLGLRGPSWCVSTGCASASDAIGFAMTALRAGACGVGAMVVVGADAHVRWETLLSMELLGVMSTRAWDRPQRASRPFDRERDGFVLGEGAWAVVLETEEHVRRREARPVAEMLGYGATCDAHHRVRPAPDMAESARAMTMAAEDAGLSMREIGVVQCHGTSTELNDALETAAIRGAFGAHAGELACSSIKSMIGHPQGACGAASVVGTIGALVAADGDARGPFVAPTINLEDPDPACVLDYTAQTARPTDARVALVNCLAFGAKNSALVMRALG